MTGFNLSITKISQIKVGKDFKGIHGIEEIVEVSDLENAMAFKTSIEEDGGVTFIKYYGDKKGKFLENIHTQGRGVISHYSLKDNSLGYREERR